MIAIALPWLGAALRPLVTWAVVALLCTAFMRVDLASFRAHLRAPGLVLAAAAWTGVAVPVLFALGCWATGIGRSSPDLFLGLMLQAVTSPMMAAPALAALMGLDAALVLAVLIVSSALTPLVAPVAAAAVGLELPLSPLALGLKLFAILAGSAAGGLMLRRVLGPAAILRERDRIDGINIILLFVFVSAVMGEVGVRFLEAPLRVAGIAALAFLVFLLLLALTRLVFAASGRKRALGLAMMTAQRNLGLMLAGTGGAVPDLTWLYFALSQLPIYLSPLLLQMVTRSGPREPE